MSRYRVLFLFISCFIFQLFVSSIYASLGCRDENNKPVDWFLLYKLPKAESKKPVKNDTSGIKYMYITSNTQSKGWVMSKHLISSPDSAPAVTLQQLYDKTSDLLWILYNDQPPNEDWRKNGGHTKGVVGGDDNGGFWLVHSVPRFPPAPNVSQYGYPDSGYKNGQSFLCVSLSAKELDNVGHQLRYNEIYTYWKDISPALEKKYPQLSAATQRKRFKQGPFNSSITLTSSGGSPFVSFAKATKFSKDLYEDWVAPWLQADLFVQSWLNGPGALKSNCTLQYTVNNVEKVQLCQISECTAFTSSRDHSKWAVSSSKNNPWLCVGDINRAASQERRGGGTVCLKSSPVWQAYYKSVTSVEPCTRRKSLFQLMNIVSL